MKAAGSATGGCFQGELPRSRYPLLGRALLTVALVGALACSSEGDEATGASGAVDAWPAVTLNPNTKAPAKLSMTALLRAVQGTISHHPELVPYTLNTPLFSDYAVKKRAIWLPPGTAMTYVPNGPFAFPEGSIVVKSFLFPTDLRQPEKNLRWIETRVLVKRGTQWRAWPYIWDEDGADATLKVSGAVTEISFIDDAGENKTSNYLIPQRNQCLDCHDTTDGTETTTDLIGIKARHLNRDYPHDGVAVNQLDDWQQKGLLKGLPALDSVDRAFDFEQVEQTGVAKLSAADVGKATRDYLDIGCAHCHSPQAVEGQTSQLYLNYDNEDSFLLGVCKSPSSAGKGGLGREFNIVPGQPDKSILLYRLETLELGAMMPDIGRSLVHVRGVELVRRWIAELPYENCEK